MLDLILKWFGCTEETYEDFNNEDEFESQVQQCQDDPYSLVKLAENFELKSGISDNDFIPIFHETSPGKYEKLFVRVKTLKDYLAAAGEGKGL